MPKRTRELEGFVDDLASGSGLTEHLAEARLRKQAVALDVAPNVGSMAARGHIHSRQSADPAKGEIGKFSCVCPNEDGHSNGDRRPSFVLTVKTDGKALVHCHAGCDLDEISDGLGHPKRDWFAPSTRRRRKPPQIFSTKQLDKDHATLLSSPPILRTLRIKEKFERQALVDLHVGLDDKALAYPERDQRNRVIGVVRHRPRSLRKPGQLKVWAEGERGLVVPAGGLRGDQIFLGEGPTSALAFRSMGLDGISYPNSTIFRQQWASLFTDEMAVYIVGDCDNPGREHAERIAELLRRHAGRVAIVDLDLARGDGYDTADLLRDRGREEGKDQLLNLAANSQAIPKPKRGRPPKQSQRAEKYLKKALADGGWHPSQEVERDRPEGISIRTLDTARGTLGIQKRRTQVGSSYRWEIALPDHSNGDGR